MQSFIDVFFQQKIPKADINSETKTKMKYFSYVRKFLLKGKTFDLITLINKSQISIIFFINLLPKLLIA